MTDFTLRPSQIKSRSALRTAVKLALQSSDADRPAMRRVVENAATMLEAEDLLPEPVAWAVRKGKTTGSPADESATQTVQLDQPPEALMDPDNREQLDVVLRTLSRAEGISYADALDRWQQASKAGRELMQTAPENVSSVLGRAGAKDLDAFTHDLKLLERRDAVLTKTLEDSQAELATETLNARGQVILDGDFDLPALLHDDLALERRWRRAAAINREYADSRDRWADDDRMHLEVGVDWCASMERGPRVAAARERVQAVAIELDQALDQAEPAKALDAAILRLSDPSSAAERPEPGLRTLDRRDAPAATEAPTFSSLSGQAMVKALELRDQTGISLDAAAASVTGYEPGDGVPDLKQPHLDGVEKGPRGELDAAIKSHVAAHKCDYACGLASLTGVNVGAPGTA